MKNQKQLEAEQRLQENYDRLNDLVESLFPSNKLSLEDHTKSSKDETSEDNAIAELERYLE
jgi:hypothetical protein